MAKPDGLARGCDAADVTRVRACWRDTVSWLQGTDPDELEYAAIVAAVAQKAALRMPRVDGYDITTWMAEAKDVDTTNFPEAQPMPLLDMAGEILACLGFLRSDHYSGWLNRVTIELLYRDSHTFDANRHLLVPALLRGPVAITYFEGARVALAHAVKLVVRFALASPVSSLTNLIHLDFVTTSEHNQIASSLAPDLRRY